MYTEVHTHVHVVVPASSAVPWEPCDQPPQLVLPLSTGHFYDPSRASTEVATFCQNAENRRTRLDRVGKTLPELGFRSDVVPNNVRSIRF